MTPHLSVVLLCVRLRLVRGVRTSGALRKPHIVSASSVVSPLNQCVTADVILAWQFLPPAGYALPTRHAALGRAASARRGAGFQPAWRHSSLLLSGADRGQWCAGTNLVQLNIYAQVSHAYRTDSMIGMSTFSTPVTRMGNGNATRQIVSTAGAAAWLPHAIRGQAGLEAVSLPVCGMGTRYSYVFVL